jgi:hypothetical protein
VDLTNMPKQRALVSVPFIGKVRVPLLLLLRFSRFSGCPLRASPCSALLLLGRRSLANVLAWCTLCGFTSSPLTAAGNPHPRSVMLLVLVQDVPSNASEFAHPDVLIGLTSASHRFLAFLPDHPCASSLSSFLLCCTFVRFPINNSSKTQS